MKNLFLIISMLAWALTSQAQIGYQVALLNRANGEPRANETVNVTVTITDGSGETVCSETKSETTNEFGILSMTVGTASTFAETDWSKLPFYIEAKVDDVLIGKSQLLSVPIAEHAKHCGSLSKKILTSKKWKVVFSSSSYTLSFSDDGSYSIIYQSWGYDEFHESENKGQYYIDGNNVYLIEGVLSYSAFYIPEQNILMFSDHSYMTLR